MKQGNDTVYDGNKAIVGVIENRHNGNTKKIPLILSNNEFLEDSFVERPEIKSNFF